MQSIIQSSKGSKLLLVLLALIVALAFAGCKGSDGAQGLQGLTGPTGTQGPAGPAGPQGPHGTFSNSNCVDCHHMSDMAIAMGIPIRPRENGGASLVVGVTGNNTASFLSAPAGTPVGLTAVSSFTVVNPTTGATTTVNVTGVYWQYMDGLPSSITAGTVSSPTIAVTIPTGLDYRQQLVNLALNPGTSWDTNRYRVVPVNDTNMALATETRYVLTVFGDDGNVYWDLIGVKASDNNVATFAPVHTTGEPVVPINLPVLITASTGSFVPGTTTWSLVGPAGSTATLSSSTDQYPYFTPDSSGAYTVTDNNTGATVTVYAGTWRGVIVGAPTGTNPLLPADYDTSCTACHNVPDNPLTAWSGNIGQAPNKFVPWSNTGHAKRFTQGLNDSGATEPYNATCFPCHTVGFVATAKNNGGFHDQPNYDAFITNVINPALTATVADDTRYATAWSSGSYTLLLQRSNIQCEQCHGPQNNTGAHPGDAGVSVAGTRESLDANMCGLCHGAATHHTRYQQWKLSPLGHSNYDLARNEGTNPSCAACHSAQGNLIYQKQLVQGNPLRTIPSGSITWTASTVQPQTCAVCHDPHNVGQESDDAYFTPEQVNNNAQTRLSFLMVAAGLNPGDTPKLPAGFKATGVGKGGQCIICHNSRNGGSGSNSYLHEDNDPVFGALAGYATPHSPAQSDVLMGHNAYFVGSTGGDLSTLRGAHSMLPDTCVTCHMEKTPPPYLWTENAHGTNHTFKADINICGDCHSGIDTSLGPTLQMDTQSQLDQVLAVINGAIISQATGTYAGNMTGASYNPGYQVTVTVGSNTYPLGDVVPINTTAGQTLAKAIWNYNLILNDSSKGVHNPDFVRNVLGNTYEQLMGLQ